MVYLRIFTLLCLSFFTALSSFASAAPNGEVLSERTTIDGKMVLGRTEKVYFPTVKGLDGIGIPAKIDTGADSTSIHAANITITAQDPIFTGLEGEELLKAIADEFDALTTTKLRDREDKTDIMVSFDLVHPYSGEMVSMTLPLFRLALIKRRGEGHLHRPVVELDLKIAGQTVRTEVNLSDRSRFSYPILIGKTFLRNTAWVDASYNYLQEHSQARVIGRKERATVGTLPIDVSLSFANRYSSLHALDIKVDEQEQQVSFILEDSNKQRQEMTLPLVRMLNFSDSKRPLVYIPIQLGSVDAEGNRFHEYILVYLRDRSSSSSQLRLGTEALNQYFIVNVSESYLGDEPLPRFSTLSNEGTSFMMSTQEQFTIDGVKITAEPSVTIKTPLLAVTSLNETTSDSNRLVQFEVLDIEGKQHVLTKNIQRKIKVGEQVRPIINTEILLPSSLLIKEVALETLDDKDGKEARFFVSPSLVHGSLLVNTRTNNLIDKQPPVKAGYVEQANVEDMSFAVKLDTGADVSSMHATDIEYFTKDGRNWVNFTYSNSDGVKQTFSREVIDEMRIRAREGEQANVRPVVKMKVKLGDIEKELAVNLRDRSRFQYSMILGKNFLKHDIVVSSDQQFILTDKL